jgi:hypothetical protein
MDGAGYSFDVGQALFTRSGKEIASLVESEAVDGFFEYVVARWQAWGIKPTTHEGRVVPPG